MKALRHGQALNRVFLLQSLVLLKNPIYMAPMYPLKSSETLPFMKMHGLGNDFVIIDSRGCDAVVVPRLARALGDRHRGVGFDQLAEIRNPETPVDGADIDLDFWNSDGSRAGACGNATRCVARYIMENTGTETLAIRTARGVLHTRLKNGVVHVNMGQPQLNWRDIPLAHNVDSNVLPLPDGPAAVGMGNPHCVFFVANVARVDVAATGAKFENDPLFPEAANVEFAQVRSRDDIRMRVWERGTGITLACGSGACAVAVAAHRRGFTDKQVRIVLDGGMLEVDWRDDGVWLSGPTAHVFNATLTRAFLENL